MYWHRKNRSGLSFSGVNILGQSTVPDYRLLGLKKCFTLVSKNHVFTEKQYLHRKLQYFLLNIVTSVNGCLLFF